MSTETTPDDHASEEFTIPDSEVVAQLKQDSQVLEKITQLSTDGSTGSVSNEVAADLVTFLIERNVNEQDSAAFTRWFINEVAEKSRATQDSQ